jgi:hypothetical protein
MTQVANLPPVLFDTGGNLPSASLTPAANLPPVLLTLVANLSPVSTTQGELLAKFDAGVVDIGGKFATVSLTPVVHLDLRIFSRIFEKIRNDPNIIISGLGEGDS